MPLHVGRLRAFGFGIRERNRSHRVVADRRLAWLSFPNCGPAKKVGIETCPKPVTKREKNPTAGSVRNLVDFEDKSRAEKRSFVFDESTFRKGLRIPCRGNERKVSQAGEDDEKSCRFHYRRSAVPVFNACAGDQANWLHPGKSSGALRHTSGGGRQRGNCGKCWKRPKGCVRRSRGRPSRY